MDQADELRILKRQNIRSQSTSGLNHALKITAVTGGKGGVGKSNIALNLALSLISKGERVCILDADFGLANIDVLLGIKPKYNISHVLSGEKKLVEIICTGVNGLKLIPGASGLKQLADLSEDVLNSFVNQARLLGAGFDRLIIDTPAGIANNVLTFLLAATEIITVTSPEPTSITDSYALLKTFKLEHGKAKVMLIMNMCRNNREGELVSSRLISICNNFLGFKPQYLGNINLDIKFVNAIRRQKPIVISDPSSSVAGQIMNLADKLRLIESEKADLGNFFTSFKEFVGP